MTDSQTVTIRAAEHAATAETRPARLLTALAQNPEPLSVPALASLLAEPGPRPARLMSQPLGLADCLPGRAQPPMADKGAEIHAPIVAASFWLTPGRIFPHGIRTENVRRSPATPAPRSTVK